LRLVELSRLRSLWASYIILLWNKISVNSTHVFGLTSATTLELAFLPSSPMNSFKMQMIEWQDNCQVFVTGICMICFSEKLIHNTIICILWRFIFGSRFGVTYWQVGRLKLIWLYLWQWMANMLPKFINCCTSDTLWVIHT